MFRVLVIVMGATLCTARLLGGDNCLDDLHNCMTCAGYMWCNATQACIRPWEQHCDDWIDTIEY